MCQVHKDILKMILASLGLVLMGVGLELMLLGPSQLSAFILAIHPPLYLVGGAIVMVIPACVAMFMAYPVLREEYTPFTSQLATATLKTLYLFIVPLNLVLCLLDGINSGLIEAAKYYIGLGLFFSLGIGAVFMSTVLAEFFMVIKQVD